MDSPHIDATCCVGSCGMCLRSVSSSRPGKHYAHCLGVSAFVCVNSERQWSLSRAPAAGELVVIDGRIVLIAELFGSAGR